MASFTSKDRIIPFVYALLPNKQQDTYLGVLRQLLYVNANLDPQTVLIDYEQAAKSAIEEVFPNATLKGCFYYLSQNIYRKVQSAGLQAMYQRDSDFEISIRMLAATAYIPEDEVIDAFEYLAQNMPYEAEPIVDYFENNYIGRQRRHSRRAP
ncbi:uncharacterized protein [Ptychodera flava]|uniref:uncharacterized protein n=1 Tax=Ptychodera flava TaxID=63121 RepID=UPI00396A1D6F